MGSRRESRHSAAAHRYYNIHTLIVEMLPSMEASGQ